MVSQKEVCDWHVECPFSGPEHRDPCLWCSHLRLRDQLENLDSRFRESGSSVSSQVDALKKELKEIQKRLKTAQNVIANMVGRH